MDAVLTTSNVGYVFGSLGTAFMVYRYFRDPQVKTEKRDAVMDVRFKSLTDMVVNLRDNHMHTMDLKIDSISESQQKMALELTKLATIIEERIPKK